MTHPNLPHLEKLFPSHLKGEDLAKTKTLFYKILSEKAHRFYKGKMQTLPKAPAYGFDWFNVWYTPGVSRAGTAIKDNNRMAYELSNKGNLVGVVSDSTRVLGDGNLTPSGGLPVMEGKAYLMKYLAGIDAHALCIDSRNEKGEHDPQKIIDFVKMVQPSYGAINLEDISQPNCFHVLDTLREECNIPVWHDDAQGTACITLAALLNALKLAAKNLNQVKIVLMGAGASNTSIFRLIVLSGGNPDNIIMFDSKSSLHQGRADIESDPRHYRKWEICQLSNPAKITSITDAIKGSDVLISLTQPGPDIIKPQWVSSMNEKAIVFACANPVPEIYPHAAKAAGAFIVATGRGDFPNQVNNSVCFPGILKGALLVRAKKITDTMAIAAAQAIAEFSVKRGIHPENIVANMQETEVFAYQAAKVAQKAIEEGLARTIMTEKEIFQQTLQEIKETRQTMDFLQKHEIIPKIPENLISESLNEAMQSLQAK